MRPKIILTWDKKNQLGLLKRNKVWPELSAREKIDHIEDSIIELEFLRRSIDFEQEKEK